MPILKDKNGIVLKNGDIVKHNSNEFFCKYSENLGRYILRIKDDRSMNWRELDWFQRVSKYCEIIGNITTH